MPNDNELPSTEEIENTVLRALRRYGYAPGEILSTREDAVGALRSLAAAGMKLRGLREQSGWTVSEIAERTGVRLETLAAFEDGDSAAAGELTPSELERLASACCGSLADLLEPEHPWLRPEREPFLGGSGCSINPWG